MAARSKGSDLDSLQKRLGWRFQDVGLLEQALTHSSVVSAVGKNNERLEFLGDRVLGLVAADLLYRHEDTFGEGDMSVCLNAFVRRSNCLQIAEAWGLWDHMILGHSKKGIFERSREGILANACEAVLGALFLDGGLNAAHRALKEHSRSLLKNSPDDLRDPKTELQQWLQKRGAEAPVYRELDRRGAVHAPTFTMEVDAGPAGIAFGEGNSKRRAERRAAENVLIAMGMKRRAG